jgi:hypothetical protein
MLYPQGRTPRRLHRVTLDPVRRWPRQQRAGRCPEVGQQLRAQADQHIGADSWYPHNGMQWNDRLFIDARQPAVGYSAKLIQWVFVFRWDGEFRRLKEYDQADPG